MQPENKKNKRDFSQQISEKEKRELKSLNSDKQSTWTGLGLFGIVGWSVVVPILLGTALGIWLDKKYAQSFSWTISFLFFGLVIGCLVAWNWVVKENNEMNENDD